jgi:L-rhamnose-proton symport protein (RhaT)
MMAQSFWPATLAVLLGGLAQGSFLLPMRLARRWAWENIWMVYSVVGLLLIPGVAARATIPHLMLVYQSVPTRTLILAALFGFGWGVANVLFGRAATLVGMALSFAVVVGMSAALGCLIPLLFSTPQRFFQPSGLLVLVGVALTTLGIVLLGFAGRSRESTTLERDKSDSPSSNRMMTGLVLSVMAGLLAPMLNYSFAFGSRIRDEATHHGAAVGQAANAIWLLALAGGCVSNGVYAAVRLFRSGTWSNFWGDQTLSQYALSSLMGVLWTGGLLLYGWGATGLGDLGAAVGWPMFQATIIVFSSMLGIAMGEWRNVESRVYRTNILGVSFLVIAIIVLSIGNRT